MARIEWAIWANEQGVASAVVLVVGGILAVVGQFKLWQIGAYAIAAGVLVFLIEYPRGKRSVGRTTERGGQGIFARMVNALGPVGRNYYFRFLVYLLSCVPCVFLLSTVLGALCLLATSLIYLRAAIANEKWLPCKQAVTKSDGGKSIKRLRPPSMAPPRMRQARENKAVEGDGEDNKV